MRGVHITCATQSLCSTTISPINGNTIGRCLRKIQWHSHTTFRSNTNIEPCITIICDIHSTNIQHTIFCYIGFRIFKRIVPPLTNKTIVHR